MSKKLDREVSQVIFSYYDRSPAQTAKTKQSVSRGRRKPEGNVTRAIESDTSKLNPVDAGKLWSESVDREKMIAKNWSNHWSFMCNVDSQGRPVENDCVDKDDVIKYLPKTTGQIVGATVMSPEGLRIQQLEFQFNSVNRRKPIDKELMSE